MTGQAIEGAAVATSFRVRSPARQTAWIAAILFVILAVLVLPPLWFLVQSSLIVQQGRNVTEFGLGNFANVLSSRQFLSNSANSLIFAAGSATMALFVGWVTAWIVERTDTPLKALAYLTAIISLGTPYILYVGAWLLFFGKAGPVNQIYRALTGSTDVLVNIYSMSGMIVVEGFLWSPLAFLLVGASLRNANPELEEAARVSGAGVWATIQRITLRLSLPSILALATLVFIRAIEAFEVPALAGMPGRVYVLTTEIYGNMIAKVPPDLGSASALSVLMLILVFFLFSTYGRFSRHAERYATITGKGFRPRPVGLGRLRYLSATWLVVNFLILLAIPMLMLVWASLLPFYQPFSLAALKLVTLNNYRAVLASEHVELAANTLMISVATATIASSLTMVAAWLSVRRAPGGRIIDQLANIPLVFPGLVLGIAVMQLFLNIPVPIYGTLWILIWAFVINYLPYGMRYSTSGMLQIHRELEEAGAICGASPLACLWRIVLPLLAPALMAGWLFVFLISARALSLAILLAGPHSKPMAVAMFDLWTNGQGTELAALGLIWTMLMTCVAIVFYWLARRSGTGTFGQA
jgi:iron(III) transport system permease protein